jgi:hypothetical protein
LARVAAVLTAYVVPAIAVWTMIGLGLAALPVGVTARAAVVAYGLGYGAVEVAGATWPAAPGRSWQVPQALMIGASGRRRVLVWGSILGPGFLTRNPYAGFGMLPLLVASTGSVQAGAAVAALIGAAHGAGRAIALLRDVARRPGEPVALLMRSLRWRRVDGLALLAVAAAMASSAGRLR